MKKIGRKPLTVRLAAYSVMIGATLALTSQAEGAIVSPTEYSAGNMPSSIDELLFQSQPVLSQGIRHQRNSRMRVKNTVTYHTGTKSSSNATTAGTPSSSGGGTNSNCTSSTTSAGE